MENDGRLYNINYTIIKRSFQYFGVLLKSSTRLSSLVILKPPIEVSACSASFSIWNAKVKLLKNECVTRIWIIFRIHSYLTRNQKIKIDQKTIMGFLIKGFFLITWYDWGITTKTPKEIITLHASWADWTNKKGRITPCQNSETESSLYRLLGFSGETKRPGLSRIEVPGISRPVYRGLPVPG